LSSKKNINSVLILLLFIIWGSIGYKYFVKKETLENKIVVQQNETPLHYTIRKDTFELKDIKNPFNNVFIASKSSQKKSSSKASNKKKPIPVQIKWPSIQYHGYILSKGNNKKLGVINVNGKIMKKREKEIILEKFKIKKIYEDSIQIACNKILKTIKLK